MCQSPLGRALALVATVGLLVVACATPEIPVVTAPATQTPIPVPTATPVPTVADQPTPTPAPSEGEPGLSADEIRIGVIFDAGVDPVSDQVSASAAEAVEAWAASINVEAGGLAGRAVVVERIPTSPLLADHAEAIDLACNRDLFALVGSTALFDDLGLEQLQSSGCALPDFPSTVTTPQRLESSVTTVSNPITSDTYLAGWARYYADSRAQAAARSATMLLEFPASVVSGERLIEAAEAQGLEFVYRPQVAFDTDFVAEVEELAATRSRLLAWPNDGGRMIDLLAELDAQGVVLNTIDCAQACYSRSWVQAAGELGNGVAVWLPTRPLEEADLSPELTRYLFWLGTANLASEATSVGVSAWASALLFQEAVNLAVGVDTADYDPATLTRAGVVRAASTIDEWDARGLHGVSNPAAGTPSPCFVLMTLNDGAWDRTFPQRRGKFNCAPENLVPLTITTQLGSEDPVPTPENEDGESDG
ncbi:MAG: ABC transporter substrate-binding protein [Acidimicrobiales bacterium]